MIPIMIVTEQIWKEYQGKLRAFIYVRINDNAVTDDILQDVFLNIHTQLETLKDNRKLESWLYQITRHAVIDYYRSRKLSEPLPDDLMQTINTNNQTEQELTSCLEPMINQLPDKYREAIFLSDISGMKQKDVAKKLGLSLSATKSRIQRGRVILKGLFFECCEINLNKHNQILEYEVKSNSKTCC